MNNNRTRDRLLEDSQIVDLYWRRDEQAIYETDRKYGKYLYTVAYNIVNDNLDSEECLNDTYLSSWNKMPPNKPYVLGAFLSKITRNIAVDKLRKNNASKRVPSECMVSLSELEDCLSDDMCQNEDDTVTEIARILNDWISTLSRRSEIIFVCRYYYSDPISNIAEMLNVSENTIFREISQMKKDLKVAIEREGYTV